MKENMKACKQTLGKIVHFAVEAPNSIGNGGQRFTRLDALCGARPRSNSLTYGFMETYKPVNCAKCLARAKAQQEAA